MALKGYKVIEFAGLAPGPFCGMILKDHGASVTIIDKPGNEFVSKDTLARGKRSIGIDMKNPSALGIIIRLCAKADVLIDPFRPGVLEKYNLGPSGLFKVNPSIIIARLTGFGQNGIFSKMAGHDINYIAMSGVLSMLGGKDRPQPPVNLIGDFAGGGLMCALGICLALLERHKSGKGQIVDASMIDGSAYLSSFLWTTRSLATPIWTGPRGTNVLDGGAHFYNVYETKDGKFMAVGAIEEPFYKILCKGLGVSDSECPQFMKWGENKEKFAQIFQSKTQDEWCKIFDLTDACVTPVLSIEDAYNHPHNSANKTFTYIENKITPYPAPKLSRTPASIELSEPPIGQHSVEILREEGYTDSDIGNYIKENVVFDVKYKSFP